MACHSHLQPLGLPARRGRLATGSTIRGAWTRIARCTAIQGHIKLLLTGHPFKLFITLSQQLFES